jgi:hypothetical protein
MLLMSIISLERKMKINEIYFKNNVRRWELEKTRFPGLTLLVGASGVGKTRILNSIIKLRNISSGHAYNGVEWDFQFTADNNNTYRWKGEFESIKELEQQEFKEKAISESSNGQQIPRLMNEELYLEDRLVFERKINTVKYEGKETPKISPYKSVLSLFTGEEKISPVNTAFGKIVFHDYRQEKKHEIYTRILKSVLTYIDLNPAFMRMPAPVVLEKIEISMINKLAITYLEYPEKFKEIVQGFKDIFPHVEEARFKEIEKHDVYELQIKEQGTDWISRRDISDGMFKTLLHIAEMKLMARGHVIMIDEFENSLGANCIDVVAADLVNPGRDLQYIITSHHPYVINNIDMKYWKVVIRNGTKVFTKSADQLKLGKSKHEAFKQLLNLEEFAEGIS